MRLPFQTVKTFTTHHSKEEVIELVRELLSRKSKFLFISTSDYVGSIQGKSFNFYSNNRSQHSSKIKGTILSENPTTIEIKISPHYFNLLYFMFFSCVFTYGAILSDEMTINGVLREPELLERISFGLFGGGGPMILCYFISIRPIKKTTLWITEKLKLKQIS